MQLHVARLCMDCDEVHDGQMCPACGSETFAFITRWIPAPERRRQPPPAEPSGAGETYPGLVSPDAGERSGKSRWLRRGAFGLAAVTALGWAWQRRAAGGSGSAEARPPSDGDESQRS